jgi:hypothetical protein
MDIHVQLHPTNVVLNGVGSSNPSFVFLQGSDVLQDGVVIRRIIVVSRDQRWPPRRRVGCIPGVG